MKAIVIGSGLGGLECALLLARKGYSVTVLEKGRQAGGCLQTFTRGGCRFDTGFHYAGGLGPGEPLHRVFDHFGLLDLPWKQVDPSCAEEIVIGNERFRLPSGIGRYIAALSERFPEDKSPLEEYGNLLQTVGDHIMDGLDGKPNPLLSVSADEYIRERFSDPLLRKVLGGSTMRLYQDARTLPLYAFAQINGSFIRSIWKLPGGGRLIAERLVRQIEALGGTVRTGAEVTGLRLRDDRVSEIIIGGTETLHPDIVISDAHPAVTLGLLEEGGPIRGIYRRRICALENSPGAFTANIQLKEGALRLPEGEIHVHRPGSDPWRPAPAHIDSLLIHTYPDSPQRIDILCWMPGPERDASYQSGKQAWLAACLDLAETALPGLKDSIENVWTSTPRTYEDYTGIPGGSAFGIIKDWKSPLTTFLSPRTGASNLFLTGGSLGLHGLLGVSMTALLTCRTIFDA